MRSNSRPEGISSNQFENDNDAKDPFLRDNQTKQSKSQSSTKKIWRTIVLLYTVTLSDGIATELIVPLLPELCKSRFGLQETEAGTAVGLLNGSRDLANFFSSFFIGHLSDHFGRKFLVVIALFFLAVTTFLIAILPTFWLAFITRAVSGFTNGNTILLRAAISDLTTGPTRALAFAYQGATYQLSRALAKIRST
jgi:DHA1 family tetracycline resistance protein-like MFS transporter